MSGSVSWETEGKCEPVAIQPAGREAPLARVVIEAIQPSVNHGRFPIKRVVGESVAVEADVFADGHDRLRAMVRFRKSGEQSWQEIEMTPLGNDRWRAEFTVSELGHYEYTVVGWVDRFASWRDGLQKKLDAGQDVSSELLEGAALIRGIAEAAQGQDDRDWLLHQAQLLADEHLSAISRADAALNPLLEQCIRRNDPRPGAVQYEPVHRVLVERVRARYGAWYEMFPRSAATEPGRHGTFRDVIRRLPYIRYMGFNVLYLPPIHPIGHTKRKGRNNSLTAGPDDPGSPWAIGSEEGGHTAIHPQLGTLEDFRALVAAAAEHGIEIALDLAFQCSPDHPYVRDHPEWFRKRPDGSIKYAENPPKKYEDIYPFDFESPAWRELWEELKRVVLFWCAEGVRIFRVDNPHTKPFPFWEWLLAEVRRSYPDVIFLSEAFTRPKIMKYLAKCGFSQSYTYFTWRNTKRELTDYLTELTQTEMREYFRPNLFANTPDILHAYLQHGGRPAFQVRATLAATLAATWGIYGPPFELCISDAVPGTEEYQNSEKYEVRWWDLDRPGNIRDYIAVLNQIREENPALHHNWNLQFVPIDNEQMIAYCKSLPDRSNLLLIIVNLDPFHRQGGWLELPLEQFGIPPDAPFELHELIGDSRFLWQGPRHYYELDPHVCPAAIIRIRSSVRTERDYEYF